MGVRFLPGAQKLTLSELIAPLAVRRADGEPLGGLARSARQLVQSEKGSRKVYNYSTARKHFGYMMPKFPMMSKFRQFTPAFFKKPVGIIFIVIIVGGILGGWFYLAREKSFPYELAPAERRNLIQEVSVTGLVKPSRELNLSLKRSGLVTEIAASVGQSVAENALLLKLDTADERRAVEEAELALDDAKLALDKLLKPIDRGLKEDKLRQAYEDGLAAAASVYANLYAILDELNAIFFGSELAVSSSSQTNIDYYADAIGYYTLQFETAPDDLLAAYQQAERAYGPAFAAYQAAARGGNGEQIELAIFGAYDLVQGTVNVIKTGRDLIQFFKNKSIMDNWQPAKPSTIDRHLTLLDEHYTTVNRYWLDLFETVNAIRAEHNVIDVDELDIESARLDVKRQESALAETRARLNDSYLRAPFAAIVTDIEPETGEIIAANSPVVSIISESQFEIQANIPEADIAKVNVGYPATVTLDAYGNDVVFWAKVMAMDPAATIIEGVATYKTTIQFTEEDKRIRAGMTANVDIIGDKRADVIAVPQRAVISKNGDKIVRVLENEAVKDIVVKTGLRGSDGFVEITEGLKEKDKVLIFTRE